MKGWCLLTLKVFLYTCGAAIGGLCAAFGIGLLLAGPASAATQPSPGGLLGSAVQTVQATVTTTTQTATSTLPASTVTVTGVVTTAQTAAGGITNTLTSTATGVVTAAGTAVTSVTGASGSPAGQLVSTVTGAVGSAAGQLVSTATDTAGSTANQLVSTVTTLTSAPRPGSGGPAPAPPSGTGSTGSTGGSGTTSGTGGTGGIGAVQPRTPWVVIPPRTPHGTGTQIPGSGHLGSGSPAAARPGVTTQAAAGRDVLPAIGAASSQRTGGLPTLPAGPPPPAGTPDGPVVASGSGSGSGSGAAGAAILICACLLVLGSARRGNKADAPSTSAILCPDEVPG
ncbi:MAG: hypothetical protein ACRDPY_13840 [Streptosporangiaceae bacterium]